MICISFFCFALLIAYLAVVACLKNNTRTARNGIPRMISTTYYQLQDYGNNGYGWVFSVVMGLISFGMTACLLDTGEGIQPLCFLGCGGLLFVACAPNFLDRDANKIHEVGAIVAAAGCVGWCLSVCWYIVLCMSLIYLFYLLYIGVKTLRSSTNTLRFHPWYWAEFTCFISTFLTYWVILIS